MKNITFGVCMLVLLSGCSEQNRAQGVVPLSENQEKNVVSVLEKSENIAFPHTSMSDNRSLHTPINTINGGENFSKMSANLFEQLMHSSEYITIDIRTPQEIAQGKILENALEMDFYAPNFPEQINALDKTKKYLIYCRSANRTANTLLGMQQMGFEEAYHLAGGISEWTRLGKKIVR